MSTYGPKGLMILQVHVRSSASAPPPKPSELDAWVSAYKPAGVCGIDPLSRVAQFTYDGPTVTYPFNLLIDAKTRKILEKEVSSSALPASFQKYLP